MSADLLRRRIEALYLARHPGKRTAHGSQTWFAGQAGVDSRTVSRWIRGEREPGGPVLKLLECLEREQEQRP